LLQEICQGSRSNFEKCKYVVFDEFDKIIQLGMVAEISQILEAIRFGIIFNADVSISIFSAEFSAYEKLVGLEFLKNDFHYFNTSESVGATTEGGCTVPICKKFANIQQYVEIQCTGLQREQSVMNVLKLISDADGLTNYATIIFVSKDEKVLYNHLRADKKIGKQIFCKQAFMNEFDHTSFESQQRPILVTNCCSGNLQKGEMTDFYKLFLHLNC
jgi:superfamily II DNA/RNA helicase